MRTNWSGLSENGSKPRSPKQTPEGNWKRFVCAQVRLLKNNVILYLQFLSRVLYVIKEQPLCHSSPPFPYHSLLYIGFAWQDLMENMRIRSAGKFVAQNSNDIEISSQFSKMEFKFHACVVHDIVQTQAGVTYVFCPFPN